MHNPVASTSQLERTPSAESGVPAELEKDLRTYGAILIQQTGTLADLPQVVMATACILFQRFWYVTSLKQFGVRVRIELPPVAKEPDEDMVVASLFLASKLEEVTPPTRLRNIINCLDYILHYVAHERAHNAATASTTEHAQGGAMDGQQTVRFRYTPQGYFAKDFYEMKEEAVIGEMQLLKRLGFNLTVQHPFGALANYLQVLQLATHPFVPQRAWNICNDALLTPLLALHPPTHVAVAAIFLATLLPGSQVALPMKPRPWWTLFEVETDEELWAVCRPILELYEEWGNGLLDLVASDGTARHGTLWRRAAQKGALPLTKAALRDHVDVLDAFE